jgi:O-antigen biosynthesis protein WbqP
MRDFSQLFKRAIDLGASLVLAPVALPVCVILLALIRLESPGSPLFVQTRVGRDQVPFRMLKLRTMSAGTENVASHLVTQAKITRLGQMLRRLKLDELPQLWNVATGSMSLVGPRPCLPTQHELIQEREARGVFAFRPGVTGPAQLMGIDMSEPERLAKVEAEYFHKATPIADVALLLRTAIGGGMGDAALKNL